MATLMVFHDVDDVEHWLRTDSNWRRPSLAMGIHMLPALKRTPP